VFASPDTRWILFAFLDVLTPWLCLILGFGVAFQRPLDPRAWVLLMLLMSFGGVAQAGGVLVLLCYKANCFYGLHPEMR
jgi:hypothetical protein